MAVQHCNPYSASLARPDLTRQFVADIRGRFRPIRGRVRHFATQADGFDLRETAETAALADGDEPEDWPDPPESVREAATPSAKAAAFAQWLRRVLRERVLNPVQRNVIQRLERARPGRRLAVLESWDHWTKPYVLGSYRSGWETAGARLRTEGVPVTETAIGSGATGAAAFAGSTAALLSLQLLYADTYRALEQIAQDAAAERVRETITKTIADGRSPQTLANRLTRDIRTLQHKRAEVVGTDIPTRGQSDAHLDRFGDAGIQVVHHGDWTTEKDNNVCPFCRRVGGETFTLDELRATLVQWRGQVYRLNPPAHPRGRCEIRPRVVVAKPFAPLSERVPGTVVTTSADRRRSPPS
jgi:hypothetical protein